MLTSMACALAVASAMGQENKSLAEQWNPVADPKAIVAAGNARFTVLTPWMIRMEWSPTGEFEDRASFAFVNRRLPVPEFKTATDDTWLTIDTGKLVLRYKKEGERFRKANLSITFKLNDREVVWRPRMKDTGNLLGTTRTLDGVSGSCPLEPGLLSRDGWTVVDDSNRILFDNSDWPWAAARKTKRAIDWYFFGYGHDYKQALADYTKVAGRIPLPPRYVFGTWWSRYWAYSDKELKELVKEFHEHDVPLDVLVIDMDWHLDGWTGYTWNPEYFPDPDGFLKWVREQGLRSTLNLHPADGVGKHEQAFPEMAKAMSLDPEKVDRVPFDCTDRKYMDAYFKFLHHPKEQQGIDFWWMDYQQAPTTRIKGLDPLFWLNYLHWSDMERREAETKRRPILFSRWGGLGNHRYQIGFSGDTFCNWPSLAFQPYFTATAGNVAYALWSHDIGGHQPGAVDPELYARWIQFGAMSPVLRTHTTKNPKAERRIWEFPEPVFHAARAAFRLRYELIPYIYTMVRKGYDTALPLCRPLYYEWPEMDEAYSHPGEYLFGDDMLVSPVVEPADPLSGCAMVKVWLPPGEWTNWFTGRTYKGPCDARLLVLGSEIPVFVRSGAVIPTQPKMNRSGEQPVDPLILNIFPGESGQTRVYEDDGIGPGYKNNQCAWTPVSHKLVNGERYITIGPVEGSYPGMLTERQYEIRLWDTWPPQTVTVDGKTLSKKAGANEVGWKYRLPTTTVVRLPGSPLGRKIEIVVAYSLDHSDDTILRSGLRGQFINLLGTSLRAPSLRASPVHAPAVDILEQSARGEKDALKAARDFQLAWFDAVSSLTKGGSATTTPASESLQGDLIRLLGLYYRVNVAADHVAPGRLTATVELAPTLNLPALAGLRGDVGLSAAEPWRIEGQDKWKMQELAEDKPLIAQTELASAGGLTTGVLKAEITVQKGDVQIELPIETTFLPSINAWWVIGPFDAAFEKALDTPLPVEEKIDLEAKYEGKDKKPVGWRQIKRPLTPNTNLADEFFVDFDDVFGGRVYQTVAYAFTYLHAPEDMDATLALGTDDGVLVLLNGKEVWRVDEGRAYLSKQDRVPVQLKKGVNTLLLKIKQGGGDWGFCVHVEDAKGKPLTQVRPSLSAAPMPPPAP
jgi:alpha-glucosidase